MRNDISKAEKHAKIAVQIAFENKYYFPLATYYRYLSEVLAPVLKNYPEDFQNHCSELISNYEESFTAFYSNMEEYSTVLKLTDTDFPYIYAVMMNLSNKEIAERMNISPRTVKRKLDAIFKILDVSNKKELRDFLKNTM